MQSLQALVGISHPIMQSGMGRVAGPELAAEVSRAGGLGILAGLNASPEELRQQIRRVRELTDRPFGVNLWLHPTLMPPVDPATLNPAHIAAVQRALAPARRAVGLAQSNAMPAARPDVIAASIETIIDERVPVWSIGLGLPNREMIDRCHERAVRVMVMVANVDDARAAADVGCDLIVAQGVEAGGHRSTWHADSADGTGTFALVPEIVDSVAVPVIAAGGIADGRGLVAALALGAAGVMLGTRFVATRESMAPEFWKQAILRSGSAATMLTSSYTGYRSRVIRGRLAEDYEASGAPLLPGLVQAAMAQDIWMAAAAHDQPEYFPMYAGQSVGLIGHIPGAGEVVASIVAEAREVLSRLDRLPRA
jgi:nitronate monooxygenase